MFVTTDTTKSAAQIRGTYEMRPEIEDDYRQLKDFWRLEDFKSTKISLITVHMICVLLGYLLFHAGRLMPDAPCSMLLETEEWQLLYCIANKTKSVPKKPYTMKEAIDYLGWQGGPKRAPSDGPPGVKTIWIGLMKLYILLAYKEYLR
ncbi:hypothetical protein FACS1894161_5470 [Spirochaetia bacterium]|nr:hypothetical protein FACS1894161_5470 [Spirochaetia bacterium]